MVAFRFLRGYVRILFSMNVFRSSGLYDPDEKYSLEKPSSRVVRLIYIGRKIHLRDASAPYPSCASGDTSMYPCRISICSGSVTMAGARVTHFAIYEFPEWMIVGNSSDSFATDVISSSLANVDGFIERITAKLITARTIKVPYLKIRL